MTFERMDEMDGLQSPRFLQICFAAKCNSCSDTTHPCGNDCKVLEKKYDFPIFTKLGSPEPADILMKV